MTHEISHFDLKHQLLSSSMQLNKGTWTDIGEAQVTYTMFGRTKVRIIRKRDRVRRALLLAGVTVFAAMAAIQQGWTSIHQAGLQQITFAKLDWSIAEPIKSLAAHPAPASHLDVAPAARSKPAMPPQPEIGSASVTQKSAHPQQLPKALETTAIKPATLQPLSASRPQTAVYATGARPVAATTSVTTIADKPPAVVSSAPNIPSITKAASSGQETASSSAADTPPTTEASPSRLIMTSRTAAVVPRLLESLPVQ